MSKVSCRGVMKNRFLRPIRYNIRNRVDYATDLRANASGPQRKPFLLEHDSIVRCSGYVQSVQPGQPYCEPAVRSAPSCSTNTTSRTLDMLKRVRDSQTKNHSGRPRAKSAFPRVSSIANALLTSTGASAGPWQASNRDIL